MATVYFFIAFASMLVLCQHAFAACPSGLSSYKRTGSVCSGYLDCSSKAKNKSPLADTLLNNADVKSCAHDKDITALTSASSQCPSSFNSGISYSDIPSSCPFCFKLVLTRWKTWPANAGTACTRRKRQITSPSYYTSADRDRTAVVELPYGEIYAHAVVEKIGPDPVTVYYMYTNGGPEGDQGGNTSISFGQGYQQTPTLTFGPITTVTEIQLMKPSYGIIGMPGTLRIIPRQ
ncbi:uncharacterized protein [Amphiura filiformis]|uniref:uncharacterized protein n=1 Tax=Amphiura filiformis TaxID=82378 RepID=UPI003B21A72D